ncbi:MAG: hypothetical protein DELT_01902 [Desulfovibrio sp.]
MESCCGLAMMPYANVCSHCRYCASARIRYTYNGMKYNLNDKPTPGPFLLYGLQWWVVTLPCVIILGVVVSRLHYTDIAMQTWYTRKLFGVMGVATIVQVLFGHRLPLVIGPASTLLVGLIASQAAGINALYTAVFLGGAVLALAGFTGLLERLRFFFTPRIVAVVLVLIAFTLSPTILGLIFSGPPETKGFSFCFALGAALALVVVNDRLPGAAKSLTVLIGLAGGTAIHFVAVGFPTLPNVSAMPEATDFPWLIRPAFDPGVLLSFVFCFLALTINELGSIESLGRMLQAESMDERVRRGAGVTGLANMAAGGLGVIGPVDFSMSAGIIAATGCASRYTLIPAGLGLLACAFLPQVVVLLGAVPGPVMGALLLYLMATQLASGLHMLVAEKGVTDFSTGITVGLPLMVGLIIAFAPADVFSAFPAMFKPIIGNGFVMGTIAVILLEHGIFRQKK